MDDGAGKAEQLPLAGGEVVAALTHLFVQPVVQLVDELVGVDVAADLHDLAVGDALFPQNDVGADGAGEQEHILQHLAEVPAQGGDLDLADVDAVDQDLALLELVVPADQGEDGALAGAGGAHKGHGLAGIHMEGNALQHPLAGNVAEPHVPELDLALHLVQEDYRKRRRNRIQRWYRVRLGAIQMINKPVLNIVLLPVIIFSIIIWGKQDLLLVLFKVSDFWMPIYRYMSIILVILFPIISILAIFDTIGNITARKDEADLQEAFEKNELRNGCPILINKKRIKGSDVIMREFYTEIPEKIWDKRKNEIADSMNIHYVKKDKPFSHGKKANGRRIVMYSGVGREDPERGEIYDEQF